VRKKRPNRKNPGGRRFISESLLLYSIAGGWSSSQAAVADIVNLLGMGKKK
jgi:hypothetical protein